MKLQPNKRYTIVDKLDEYGMFAVGEEIVILKESDFGLYKVVRMLNNTHADICLDYYKFEESV